MSIRFSDNFRRIVVDTGPMLIHASGAFDKGSLLRKAVKCFRIAEPDALGLYRSIDMLFSTAHKIFVTPYVLAEFCDLANSKLRLRDNRLRDFVRSYSELLAKMEEFHIEKRELLNFKKAWKFCFTDSSLALTSMIKDAPLLTVDRKLRSWCENQGIRAKDVYYDIYLSV